MVGSINTTGFSGMHTMGNSLDMQSRGFETGRGPSSTDGNQHPRRLRSTASASRNHGTPNAINLIMRLKGQLLANGFRRSVWMTVAFIAGALYALGNVVTAIVGAFIGMRLNPALTAQLLIIVGAIGVLAWLLGPIVAFGVDTTIDPHRFALFPMKRNQLMAAMTGAGLIGIPGIATALAFIGTALAWWRTPAALPVALLGALGGVLLAIIGSRALTTWLAPKLEQRGVREVITLILLVPLMLIGPISSWIGVRTAEVGQAGGLTAILNAAANWLGWTPFGAPWSAAHAAAAGDWLGVLARLGILALGIIALWALWSHALGKAMERPTEVKTSNVRVKGVGFFDRFPATPTGAIAARSATYWLRDPRYMAGLIVVPLLPIALAFGASQEATLWPMVLAVAPFTAWILAFGTSNDIGYDYTAFALHVSTGVPGRADRLGRLVPTMILGIPIIILYSVLSAWYVGRVHLIPPVLGASLGAFFGTLGIAAAASAKFIYPVAKPGESPFKQPQGAAAATMISQFATMGLSALVCLPVTALAVWAIAANNPVIGWITLLVGPLIGIPLLMAGINLGGRWVDQTAPELLQKVHNFA